MYIVGCKYDTRDRSGRNKESKMEMKYEIPYTYIPIPISLKEPDWAIRRKELKTTKW